MRKLTTKKRRRAMAIIAEANRHYEQLGSLLEEAVHSKMFRAPTSKSLWKLRLEACGHGAYMSRIEMLRENLR